MMGYHSRRHLILPEAQTLPVIAELLNQLKGEDHYVYERQSCWYLALGQRASLTVDAAGEQATTITDNGINTTRVKGSPAEYARRFQAAHGGENLRIYGEAGFHYAFCVQEHAYKPGRWPLLNLIVPREELIFCDNGVTVLAGDALRCRQLSDWILSAVAVAKRRGGDARLAHVAELACDQGDYCQRVCQAIDEINDAHYSKVILARAMPLKQSVDMAATLLRGRQANTPVRTFLLRQGEREAVGFCPELVMSVEQDKVSTDTLAGTCVKHQDAAPPNALLNHSLSDEKEIVEHVMSVRAAVEEMQGLCQPESVVINDLMSVRQRGNVQHLGSRVSGELGFGKDAWDAFDALFPAITATGVPKRAALSAIARLESSPRELYSGAILWLDGKAHFEAALVLRSAFQDSHQRWLQAGAGVIAQSSPIREFTETQEKLDSIAPYLVFQQKTR